MELANKQHEQFAQGIARGLSGAEACRLAKFSTHNPRTRAARLMKRPDVKARVDYLLAKQEADEKQLAAINDTEVPFDRHLDWLLHEHRRNLAISNSRTDTRESRATLVEIGKLVGAYVERSEITHVNDPLTSLTGPELAALRAFVASRRSSVLTIEAEPPAATAQQPAPMAIEGQGETADAA